MKIVKRIKLFFLNFDEWVRGLHVSWRTNLNPKRQLKVFKWNTPWIWRVGVCLPWRRWQINFGSRRWGVSPDSKQKYTLSGVNPPPIRRSIPEEPLFSREGHAEFTPAEVFRTAYAYIPGSSYNGKCPYCASLESVMIEGAALNPWRAFYMTKDFKAFECTVCFSRWSWYRDKPKTETNE